MSRWWFESGLFGGPGWTRTSDLGIKRSLQDFGPSRSSWIQEGFGSWPSALGSAGFGGSCCPGVAPENSRCGSLSSAPRRSGILGGCNGQVTDSAQQWSGLVTLVWACQTGRRWIVRRQLAALGVLVCALGALAAMGAEGALAATTVNCAPFGGDNLQAAITAAAPGSTLLVKGRCAGNFTVPKNLTLTGSPTATLDGSGHGAHGHGGGAA